MTLSYQGYTDDDPEARRWVGLVRLIVVCMTVYGAIEMLSAGLFFYAVWDSILAMARGSTRARSLYRADIWTLTVLTGQALTGLSGLVVAVTGMACAMGLRKLRWALIAALLCLIGANALSVVFSFGQQWARLTSIFTAGPYVMMELAAHVQRLAQGVIPPLLGLLLLTRPAMRDAMELQRRMAPGAGRRASPRSACWEEFWAGADC